MPYLIVVRSKLLFQGINALRPILLTGSWVAKGGSHEKPAQETGTANTFRNCRHVALIRPARPRFYHNDGPKEVRKDEG